MTVGPHQTKLELNKILLKEGTVEDGMEQDPHGRMKNVVAVDVAVEPP